MNLNIFFFSFLDTVDIVCSGLLPRLCYSSCNHGRVLLLWIPSNLTLVALLFAKFHDGTMMVI